jgi:hypothetical protein
MHGSFCCPQCMDGGMCSKNPGCMPHDSLMKCCPKNMKCDSTRMPVQKK